jgi:hypothetical protein
MPKHYKLQTLNPRKGGEENDENYEAILNGAKSPDQAPFPVPRKIYCLFVFVFCFFLGRMRFGRSQCEKQNKHLVV